MSRFWIIAPCAASPSDQFEKVWAFDLANGTISIGWPGLENVLSMTKADLSERVAQKYQSSPPQTRSLITNMLWAFYREISPGDVVIARRGRKKLAAVGTVTKSAVWSPGNNPSIEHSGFLTVEWQISPRDIDFGEIVFPMPTLAETTSKAFDDLMGSSQKSGQTIAPGLVGNSEIVEDPKVFVLEKYLEDFIVSNFKAIFNGTLEIYKDSEGNEGQQYTTEIGSIDILATEPSSKSFVVIELKRGRPSDQVVGQILRYMGWVQENLCTEGQSVKGVVICQEQDKKLNYAMKMVRDIDVKYYSVSFDLRNTP